MVMNWGGDYRDRLILRYLPKKNHHLLGNCRRLRISSTDDHPSTTVKLTLVTSDSACRNHLPIHPTHQPSPAHTPPSINILILILISPLTQLPSSIHHAFTHQHSHSQRYRSTRSVRQDRTTPEGLPLRRQKRSSTDQNSCSSSTILE